MRKPFDWIVSIDRLYNFMMAVTSFAIAISFLDIAHGWTVWGAACALVLGLQWVNKMENGAEVHSE